MLLLLLLFENVIYVLHNLCVIVFLFLGALRRCFQCRSRGELGSCKDPFRYNITQIESEHGITAVPCASGWCGKVIESQGTLRDDGNLNYVQIHCQLTTKTI